MSSASAQRAKHGCGCGDRPTFSPTSVGPWTLASALMASLAITGCGGLQTIQTVHVPAGEFVMGSSLDERARALELAYAGRGAPFREAHAWIASERPRSREKTGEYWIMQHPVTRAEYRNYIRSEGRAEPFIDEATWARQNSGIDYEQVRRELWHGGTPEGDRQAHPVVLVSREDAARYCQWWGDERNGDGRLPSEAEWERAARGDEGQTFPWGEDYDPRRLNSADARLGTTVPVGVYAEGISPHGAFDMAGNVFEWTETSNGRGTYVVKGGAFTTHGASSRAAARHDRPGATRHIAIGFRCVLVQRPEDRPNSTNDEQGRVQTAHSHRMKRRTRGGRARADRSQ